MKLIPSKIKHLSLSSNQRISFCITLFMFCCFKYLILISYYFYNNIVQNLHTFDTLNSQNSSIIWYNGS